MQQLENYGGPVTLNSNHEAC